MCRVVNGFHYTQTVLQTGLVSITFRQLSPGEIVALTAKAGLHSIEWGGDVHVPHGNTEQAREVLAMTKAAGLDVAAYGSYYRVGHSEDEGLTFVSVLETAQALGAPVIRVWAGKQNSGEADVNYRRLTVNELPQICDLAAAAGVLVALEFHGGTLTDTAASARQLLEEVDHPSLRTLWQPRVDASTLEAKADLQLLLPWLAHLHVFQWQGRERRPLAEGRAAWREYFALAQSLERPVGVLLEFVKDDSPAQFLEDARVLRELAGAGIAANESAVDASDSAGLL